MRTTEALADLLRLGRPILSTREAAVRLGVSVSRASQLLRSLQDAGLSLRLRRGLWTLRRDLDPFSLPPYLTTPYPAYVSLWSALARHGMIEQVPRQIFVASLARTQTVHTSLGDFSIHHLAPELFGGYREEAGGYHLATPEKALFDTVYLLVPGGGKVHLPEVELPAGFREAELDEWTGRIERSRLRTMVRRELAASLRGAVRG